MMKMPTAVAVVSLALLLLSGDRGWAEPNFTPAVDRETRIDIVDTEDGVCGRVADKCVRIANTRRGNRCGNPDSFEVHLLNQCDQRVYVTYAVQRADGTWSGGATGLRPLEKTTSAWVCAGTGKSAHIAVMSPDTKRDWTCSARHPDNEAFRERHP
jgi:hypothetical protein